MTPFDSDQHALRRCSHGSGRHQAQQKQRVSHPFFPLRFRHGASDHILPNGAAQTKHAFLVYLKVLTQSSSHLTRKFDVLVQPLLCRLILFLLANSQSLNRFDTIIFRSFVILTQNKCHDLPDEVTTTHMDEVLVPLIGRPLNVDDRLRRQQVVRDVEDLS